MIATSWQFLAVEAATLSGFVWYWRRQRGAETLTSKAFALYFECIADARDNGYAGVLPAGPKTPLRGLPKEERIAEPAAEVAQSLLRATSFAATRAPRQRARGRSRVT